MSSDPKQAERFFVPAAIMHFLIALTLPDQADKILNINLEPGLLHPEIQRILHRDPDFVKSTPTTEELHRLEQTYDVILCGPTFGVSAGQLPGETNEPGEEFWLKWSIAHLSQHGRLAVIVPNGLLSNYSQQNIRTFLLANCTIQAVIELPLGWSQGTNVQASILLITLMGNPDHQIKMFRLPRFEMIPWSTIVAIALGRDKQMNHKPFTFFTVNASQLNAERLDANYHDPKYQSGPVPDATIFQRVLLKELVDIGGGERLATNTFASLGIPYIQVSNVGNDGNLYLRDAKLVDPEKRKPGRKAGAPHWHCTRGDLIFTVAGTLGKVALIDDKLPSYGVYINTSSRRLRVKDQTKALPEYLFIHLRSDIIQQQVARLRSGSVIPVLSNPDLGKIAAYIPPVASQEELVATLQKTHAEQTQKVLSRFYGFERDQPPRQEPGSQAVPSQPPIEEDIIKEFPFPIARAFSFFQQSQSESYRDQLQNLIALSDAIIYYLSAICTVDQQTRLKIVDKALLSAIRDYGSDHSLQKRLDIISTIQKFAKQDNSMRLFAPEIKNADISACKEIHKRRNSIAHTASTSERESEKFIKELMPKIRYTLASLRFLKDYKLVLVTPVAYRNKLHFYKYTYLMSDNDVYSSVEESSESVLSAETGHVSLMNSQTEFLDLHPFYLLHAWERTGMREQLCFFKYYSSQKGVDTPQRRNERKRMKIESTLRSGEYDVDGDEGLEELLYSVAEE